MRATVSQTRPILLTVAVMALAATNTRNYHGQTSKPPKLSNSETKLPNKDSDFYDKDGKFLGQQGQAGLFRHDGHYGYPVPAWLQTNMWATDFGLAVF